MRYLSIDLETSALDPDNGQILEFAAVLDDTDLPLDDAPGYHRLVMPADRTTIRGEPYALWMNAELIKEIHDLGHDPTRYSNANLNFGIPPERLPGNFAAWLYSKYPANDKITIVGKNYGMFDNGWLKDIKFSELVFHSHRVIDPGSLFWIPASDGARLPDTRTCLIRAGIDPDIKHRALGDALQICELVRHYILKHGTLR